MATGGRSDQKQELRLRELRLPEKPQLPPSIPLILQSDYKWSKEDHSVVKIEGQDGPVELKLVPEAVELLKTIRKPVAVLAVCGPYRTGKSYFISRIISKPGSFQLGHSMEACTRGIWLSTFALECDDFVLLLLDTEGIGAVEGAGPESITTKLLVSTILLSSLLVYNSMEVPRQNDLQEMSSFAHLSSSISIHKAKKKNVQREFQKYFPHFFWLLRDVLNLPYDDEGEEIDLVDYLHTTVLKTTGQTDCDTVVKAICTLFPQPLYCDYLPPPSDNPEVLHAIENDDELEEFFIEQATEVINKMKQIIRPKMGFDAKTKVRGRDLAVLADTYVDAINQEGSVPSLHQGWMAVIRLKLSDEVGRLVGEYEEEMKSSIEEKLPMEEKSEEIDETTTTLLGLHLKIFTTKLQSLVEEIRRHLQNPSDDTLNDLPPEESEVGTTIVNSFKQEIAVFKDGKVTGGSLLKYTTLNYSKSEKQCEELWSAYFADKKITERSAKALNESDAVICKEVCDNIQLLREEYSKKSIGPARGDVLSRKEAELEGLEKVLCSIPGPPINLRVVGTAKDAIKLRWDPPEINADAAKKYKVQTRLQEREWREIGTAEEWWYIVRKLKSNTEYELRVASWNDQLRGELQRGLKAGTLLDRLARVALSALSFVGGMMAAPLIAGVGLPVLTVAAPVVGTIGAPIVGAAIAYKVYSETGSSGELAEDNE